MLFPLFEVYLLKKRSSEISTPPEIAVGTHIHAQNDIKDTPVFLPADGEGSWSLLPISASLLSGGTVQSENILYPQGDRSGLRKPKKDKH